MPTGTTWLDKHDFKVAFTDVEYQQRGGPGIVKPQKGTSIQQAKVKLAVKDWEAVCNVSFEFIDDVTQADFRVGFNALVNNEPDKGSWSFVGTGQPADRKEMTMHFGWITSDLTSELASDRALDRASDRTFLILPADKRLYEHATIVHEFGHALGLAHEHQNPFGGIKWDEKKVLEEYSGPNNWWSPEAIRHNILNVLTEEELKAPVGSTVSQHTLFDRMSIMFYGAQARLQQGEGVQMPQPLVISKVDANFMQERFGPPRTRQDGPGIHKQLGLDVYGEPDGGVAAPQPAGSTLTQPAPSTGTLTVTTVTKFKGGIVTSTSVATTLTE